MSNKKNPDSTHRIRKSGLRSNNPLAGLSQEETERILEEEIENELKEEYKKLLPSTKKSAYIVQFPGITNDFFISFQTRKNRDTSKWEACKYFASVGHPKINKSCYSKARRRRIPELDKYSETGKIPVESLLKLGAQYHCGLCNSGPFNYDDFLNGKCIIVEGEGNINDFTSGILVCSSCRRKHRIN